MEARRLAKPDSSHTTAAAVASTVADPRLAIVRSCACTDVQPADHNFSCLQQRDYGKCGRLWMLAGNESVPEGFCQRTCGRCPCSPTAVAAVAAPGAENNTAAPATNATVAAMPEVNATTMAPSELEATAPTVSVSALGGIASNESLAPEPTAIKGAAAATAAESALFVVAPSLEHLSGAVAAPAVAGPAPLPAPVSVYKLNATGILSHANKSMVALVLPAVPASEPLAQALAPAMAG